MSTCKYCKQSAGLFSSAYKECEAKHSAGVEKLRKLLSEYFLGVSQGATIQREISQLRKESFLNTDDITSEFTKALDGYTVAIHRPFSPQMPQVVTSLVSAVGEPYSLLDRNGAITRFAQKLIKGHIAEYFTGKQPIAATQTAINGVTRALPIANDAVGDACYYMLEKAATNFLKDGLLTPQEERLVNEYTTSFGIQPASLPTKYQSSDIAKISQAGILSGLQQGQLPPQTMGYPIMLGKGESVLWVYDDVKCFEEKVKREYISNRGGVSIKIAKGVYYRPSTGRTKPVEHNYMNLEGTGNLYVTNKHLIFNSPTKGVKIPYTKIIGVTPYSDGIELNRDGNAKRMILQGFDSWFVMNLLSVVANS